MSIQQQVIRAEVQSQRDVETRKRGNWKTDAAGFGFVLPFLLVYAIFLLWPVLLGLNMSFYNWSLSGSGANKFLGLGNYQELFSDPDFWSSLGHTLVFTVISTPILVIFALVLALLANQNVPIRWLYRLAFFAPFVLPVTVVVIIWNWIYQPGFGLLNNILTGIGLQPVNWLSDPNVAMSSVIIVTVWWTVGSNFMLYLAGLQQIPQELYEAAAIDGAGTFSQVRWITVPLLNRMTLLITILQVIASLQVFAQIYLLTGGGPDFSTRPVIQYIYETGFSSFRVGFASAASYILFFLILIVTIGQFMLFQRPRKEA